MLTGELAPRIADPSAVKSPLVSEKNVLFAVTVTMLGTTEYVSHAWGPVVGAAGDEGGHGAVLHVLADRRRVRGAGGADRVAEHESELHRSARWRRRAAPSLRSC